MAEEKKRYWLKLDKDFLKSPQIKVIQKMPNGKDYIILYLSLMLESVETIGHLKLNGLIPYNAEIISAITETNIDIVRSALEVFKSLGMIQYLDDGTIFMVAVPKMTGKESESAERVRRYREKLQQKEILALPKLPKSNAERQKQHKAKKYCEEYQHIPFIEDYVNNKRYNGNYYIVLKRDKLKCSICGSIENLCVHHIDGYDELKPENNNTEKMITLCRSCHRQVHEETTIISEEILESIDYYCDSNESNETCNTEVTKCNDNKEKEEDKQIIEKINNEEIKKEEETKEQKEIKAIEKLQQYKNPDLMFDKKIDEVFKLYKKKCPNLCSLVFEERNIERRQQVKDLLILCRYDMGYIEGLFNRANEQITFYDEKINFQSLIKNHEKIYQGIGAKKPEKKETAETMQEKFAKWEAEAKEREAREKNDINW
jgi:predicted phage replisome organizer